MSLFQTSVIKKHLQVQDNGTLEKAYIAFVDYFHHPDIQRNIRASKEEQFQEGFLRELFVNILGYTLNPQPNFNLTTELKNEKGAKKTDGAILSDGNALAVIELKGSNTTDLEKVNAQAFNYKNNQTGCVYVIISNFEKLRFFIHNAVEHIEFNLFTLTKDEFNLLYFCLSADTLLAGLPEKAKYESVIAEKDITKQLYQDYAAFKSDIWLSLTKNATNKEALLLYKKTQKLLDRFLFILFSEDSGILPPNSISRIEKRWRVLKEEDAYKPLYDIFKQFFGYINEGRESNTTSETIFAYNGGLFLPDDILDNAMFDDGLLHTHIMKLTSYDFQSDIDVNILGHIFENSLNDVDQIKAHINGTTLDKKNTKRKDDGVFYTERYITKFIVDNTVGTLCEIQKNNFGVIDNEYAKGSKNRKKSIIKELHKNLGEYRDWLLTITICDPACGSGAFLNQALEYLINEHAYIDELESKLFGSGFVFRHISDHILENNIFGVDINEESIEIAKLSLWLRTAEHGRKLTSLNNNIKCGNSLVNDPDIAKDKAFNWVDEFPQVFENNGFDIVIGNPPWGANLSKPELNYVKQKHSDIVVRMINSFMFFVNMSLELVNEKGLIGVITPDVILYQKDNEKLRQKINASAHITHIVNMGDGIFEDVATACAITIANKNKPVKPITFVACFDKNYTHDISSLNFHTIEQALIDKLPNTIFPTRDIEGYELLINLKHPNLSSFIDDDGIQRGVSPDLKDAFIVDTQTISQFNLEIEKIKPTVTGGVDVKRFAIPEIDKQIIYTQRYDDAALFPNIVDYISSFKNRITCKEVNAGKHPIHVLHRARDEAIFTKPSKIIGVITGDKIITAVDENQLYPTDGLYLMNCIADKISNKALSAILNSNLSTSLYRLLSSENGRAMSQVKPVILANLPIPEVNIDSQHNLESLYDDNANDTACLQNILSSLLNLLISKYPSIKPTKKLLAWHQLEFDGFISELKRVKIPMSLSDEAQWMNYFNTEKKKAISLVTTIAHTDAKINTTVYKLYKLTQKEINYIETL